MEKLQPGKDRCHKHGEQKFILLADMGFGVCPVCVQLRWYAEPVMRAAKKQMRQNDSDSRLTVGDLEDVDFKDIVC